ncbi:MULTISPECIES: redoxin domain-containing protein [unclassified Microcoleus]|uniref:redoxin domain-containing protein n=1 Tax=unclassified Microcoleus TaxID=2642155 RepID=UPI002FD79651
MAFATFTQTTSRAILQCRRVSTDGAKSHAKFAAKDRLPFPLLCDSSAEVATTVVTDSKSLWEKNLWALLDLSKSDRP